MRPLPSMVLVLVMASAASAQDGRAGLEAVAKALGADTLRTIEMSGSGVNFAVGQSAAPGMPWPRFNVKSFSRAIDYESASLRDQLVRTQGEDPPRGGGGQPIRGEQVQHFVVSGDHAWNVVGDASIPAPISLLDRQLQLWTTPHGLVKAALARGATREGRVIRFAVPGRFTVRATLDAQNLIERVDAVVSNPVVGDLAVEIGYGEYRDFGGVKAPTRIRQVVGGHPALDVAITAVRPNAAVSISVPDAVRQAGSPYGRIATQMVADGVWYVGGGSHHSVAIEMADHVIVVEGPQNDERALAVIAEVRELVTGKPIRYLINSHHHFDHAGGVRAFAGEGVTVITSEVNRAFFERTLAAPATVGPDHLAKSGRRGMVEGVRDRRVLTDGTRVVEIRHLAGNGHHDGLLMVYLPKEKLLVEADAYTPAPPDAPPPAAVNPYSVNLADNIRRQGLAVDRILPLHGRIVPLADLRRAIGEQ
jgi:glyoxylase-like metal-dependent hydrolase (beta-lactamase superfamily II)